jgi:hypothetical protein
LISIMSGYPFEDSYGYARAVRVGDRPDLQPSKAMRTSGAIATVADALGETGAELRHVV